MFSLFITVYLFLGGTGAGTCFVAAIIGLFIPRLAVSVEPWPVYRTLLAPSYLLGLFLLVSGVLFLVADLGRAEALPLIFISMRPTFLTLGSYALFVTIVLAAMLAALWLALVSWKYWIKTLCEVLIIVASLVTMLYAGFLLMDLTAVPLWSSWCLPILFLLSSISCGIGLIQGSLALRSVGIQFKTLGYRLIIGDAVTIAVECTVLAFFLFSIYEQSRGQSTATEIAASLSLSALLSGDYAPGFWSFLIVVGLIAPLAIELISIFYQRHVRVRKGSFTIQAMSLISAAAVLIGGFALRFFIVEAGLHPLLGMGG